MVKQKITYKLYKDDEPHAFFGLGPYLLLQAIDETHSITKAAKRMDMAYTKALSLIKHAENALEKPLITAQPGGKGGGGSELTETARAMIAAFEKCQTLLNTQAETVYHTYFDSIFK